MPTIFKTCRWCFSMCMRSCVWPFCLWAVSALLGSTAPQLWVAHRESSAWEGVTLLIFMPRFHWPFGYTLLLPGKESCSLGRGRSQLGSSGPSLSAAPSPVHFSVAHSLWGWSFLLRPRSKADPRSSVPLHLILSFVVSACFPENQVLPETDCQWPLEFTSAHTLTARARAAPLFLLGNLVFSFVLQKWENPLILKQMYANTFINIGNRKISYCFLYK